MSILGNTLLIRVKLFPSKLSRVVISNQDRPLIPRLPMAICPMGPAQRNFRAGLGSSEGIGAGIHGIGQDRQDSMVKGRLPIYVAILIAITNRRQCDSFLAEPEQRLPCASTLLELLEHQTNGILYPQVGIEFDGAVQSPAEAHRQAELEFCR